MSSHHIVREKQEPALLILGLDDFPEEMLGQLLEWSPTVIATADAAEILNTLEIKMDWIISDEERGDMQSDVKQLAPGNDTPATAALRFLTDNKYPAVNVITNQQEFGEFLPYAEKINLVILNARQKVYTVTSGFSKWKPAGEQIEVLSKANNLQYKGLHPISKNKYQTTNDGFFALNFQEPYLLIAEQLE